MKFIQFLTGMDSACSGRGGGGGGGGALVPSCVGHVRRPAINLLDYCKVLLDYSIWIVIVVHSSLIIMLLLKLLYLILSHTPAPPPPPLLQWIHSWFLRKGRSTKWCPKYYHKHVSNMHAPDRVGPRVLEFLWLDTCSTIARHTMSMKL
jgi:hypothetical protein